MTSREFSNIVVKLGYSYRDSVIVSKIIKAEIGGQIEYYKKHKEYVQDQTKFIYQYLGLI